MIADDPFAGFDDENESASTSSTSAGTEPTAQTQTSGAAQNGSFGGRSGGGFAQEIFSKKIAAKFRMFFLDLKQSSNGKFIKISEKSRGGQKSTIMFDAEDIDQFITALQEMKNYL